MENYGDEPLAQLAYHAIMEMSKRMQIVRKDTNAKALERNISLDKYNDENIQWTALITRN